MKFISDNERERLKFIDRWADYVSSNPDWKWSRQQNLIINSCLRTAGMSKEAYLKMKQQAST